MDPRFLVEQAQASFRGVPFHVHRRDRSGGRRGPTHELPQRDEPDGEDLGRKCRVFMVEAILFGRGEDDDSRDLDAEMQALTLISALEDVWGPGIYYDPWHGAWSVICRTYEQLSDDDAHGVARLRIAFEESGAAAYPLASTATAVLVGGAADDLGTAAASSFADDFSVSDVPSWISQAASDVAGTLGSTLSDLGLPQLDLTSAIGVVAATSKIAALTENLADLLQDGFGPAVVSTFVGLSAATYSRRGSLGAPTQARTAFATLAVWGSDLPAVPTTTPSRQVQAANQDALVALVRRAAIAEECRALGSVTWDSYDAATADRDATLARLDTILLDAADAGDDDAYKALVALKAAVVADVAARAPTSRKHNVTLATPTPARVLAYQLYGDARWSDDLVTRNDVAHPLFVPANQDLEYVDADSQQ